MPLKRKQFALHFLSTLLAGCEIVVTGAVASDPELEPHVEIGPEPLEDTASYLWMVASQRTKPPSHPLHSGVFSFLNL